MSKKKVRYMPAEGCHLSEEQAQQYGEFIATLVDQDGVTTPEVLVVRRGGSPIEGYFESDIDKAAYEHWLNQARYLLRSIWKEVKGEDDEVHLERAFYTTIIAKYVEEGGEKKEIKVKVYKHIEDIMGDPDSRKQLLKLHK